MAWGASKSIDGLLKRLTDNDQDLTSIHIFQGKKFGSQEAEALAKALETNTNLLQLYASGHELDPSSISSISQAIGKNRTLRVLCIGNSQFGDLGVKLLLEGISSNTSLQELDLECKNVSYEGCKAISKALSDGLAIERLLLARNVLGDEGVSNLCRALPSSKLVELDLRDCRISSEGAQFLADVLPQCKSLKVIKLDENNLGEGGGMALGNAIQNSQVEDLNVNSSSICDEGFGALVKASCSSNLRILEANSCGISQDGAEFLQQALSQKSSLRSISLRDNCILDEGVSYIGEGLLAGPDLEELDLGKNQIGEGAHRILQGNTALKKLNLEASKLGDEGAINLSNALASHVHTNLIQLELSGCEIGAKGMKRLFEVLQGFSAPALEVLLLAGNPGVSEAKFSTQVDLLSTTRTDLDIVWRGNCDQPPTAVDGGPPKPMGEPDWAIDPNSLESQSVRS